MDGEKLQKIFKTNSIKEGKIKFFIVSGGEDPSFTKRHLALFQP